MTTTTCADVPPDRVVFDASALPALFATLRADGYRVIGPTVRDHAIVLAELRSADQLPFGVGVELEAGRYRLRARGDDAVFGHSAGPQSWKNHLHPPRQRLWSARRDSESVVVEADHGAEPPPRHAFLGVRPCDLRAIAVLDRVLVGGDHPDPRYGRRRDGLLVIAVNCTEPGATCFCVSMGAGPAADGGYDILLTEQTGEGSHTFVAHAATDAGAAVLAEVPTRPATAAQTRRADGQVAEAAGRMGRSMPEVDLRRLLVDNRESPRWDDVASRCLTCGNCTMVCPTCFCVTVEDTSDLTGDHVERHQVWDSCFNLDFSYLHGGSVRASGASRYRQWMTHKLSSWHDQFGSSGCVGCGRCLVWCPVGIDITAEAHALAEGGAAHDPGER